jgi:hypothetical protein
MSEAPKPIRRKVFDIVGEAGNTRSGEPRQKVLLRCEPGDPVELRREPNNKADPNAVLVLWEGEDIGYLPRETAALVAPHMDAGRLNVAQIHCINGGLPDYPNYGVEISVAWDGKACPAHRPLDERQQRSRVAKLAAAERQRDASGAFASRKAKGCMVTIGLLIVPGSGVLRWLFGG